MIDEYLYECMNCGAVLGEAAGVRVRLTDEESKAAKEEYDELVDWKLGSRCPVCEEVDPPIKIINHR